MSGHSGLKAWALVLHVALALVLLFQVFSALPIWRSSGSAAGRAVAAVVRWVAPGSLPESALAQAVDPAPGPTPTPEPAPLPTPRATPPDLTETPKDLPVSIVARPDTQTRLEAADRKLTVTVPAGATSEEIEVRYAPQPLLSASGMKMLRAFSLEASPTADLSSKVTSFQKDLQISIKHDEWELAGGDIRSLRLYYLDEASRSWQPLPSQYNPLTRTLTATTNHFSYFGEQMAPLSSGPGRVMAFQNNLHSGAATASYPIEVPPGPGGFTPRIELTYNSGSVDEMKSKRAVGSWVGIGWSLSLGKITWEEGSNRYFLDLPGGSAELLQGGSSGAWYTRPDQHYKVTRDYGNNLWEVWDRSGNYYRFGGTTDSRQYHDSNVYYRWDLSRMKTPHGDTAIIDITYTRDIWNSTVRSAYPSVLKYTNGSGADHIKVNFNSSFDITNDPTDGNLRYDTPRSATAIPSPPIVENKKLDSIEIQMYDGSAWQRVRKYYFAYSYTNASSSTDYGGTYYAGTHKLDSITQKDKDDSLSLPAMTFTYANKQTYLHDTQTLDYTGNPGNPADFNWPHLTTIHSGYSGTGVDTVTYVYEQKPLPTTNDVWTREVVTEKTLAPGIGPSMTYTYSYTGNPQYFLADGTDWEAEYRGFSQVTETDAAGSYSDHYYYTTDSSDGNDEKRTGREWKTERRSSSGTLLQQTVNTWSVANTADAYAFLRTWGMRAIAPGQFEKPAGVAVDSSGNVYVADTSNHRIQKFSSSGSFLAQWGNFGTGNGQFNEPTGVAVDGSGNVYVADSLNDRIQKFSSSGAFLAKWGSYGSADGQFDYPTGVAVDSSGSVYVADSYNDRIQKFNSSGTFQAKWGSYGTGDGQFRTPSAVAVYSTSNVYVADSDNDRIQKFDTSGTFLAKWGSNGSGDGQFTGPYGVAVDGSNNVYVADTYNYRIQKFSSAGVFQTKWGSQGTADGQFKDPKGVAADSSYVYVADTNNHRIQKFNTSGVFQTKWGSNATGDGQFIGPYGAAVDSSGNVYVADTGNHRIQKFSSVGSFSTKWGSQGSADGQFYAPYGVGVDGPGNVYVADTQNHRIQKFNGSGNFLAKWGSYGTGDSQFNAPRGVAIDGSGNIYVADTNNHRIQKYNSSYVFQGWFGKGNLTTGWHNPGSGEYGVSGSGDGQFSAPWGIAVDSSGNVYVADNNNRIQKFNSSGAFQTKWGSFGTGDGQFLTAYGVGVDSSGNVYVADQGNYRIQKFNSSGTFQTKWGSQGSGDGQFNYPTGVAVDSSGNVYVAEAGNHRIQKFARLYDVTLTKVEVTTGSKTAQTQYEYDSYGNVTTTYHDGDTGTSADNSRTERVFYPNTTAWILNKPARESVKDGSGNLKADTYYYYDGNNTSNTTPPTVGDVTRVQRYSDGSNSLSTYYTYDSYGNRTVEVDARNNARSTSYDGTHHTYPAASAYPIPWNGLVGYWKLDENTGTTTADSSGNGKTGTLTNGPTWASGKAGPALSFDGSNDYVNMGNAADFTTGDFSIAFWVKTTTTHGGGAGRDIVNKGAHSSIGYKVEYSYGNIVTATIQDSGGSATVSGASAINDGAWHHVVAVFNRASTGNIYVDGISDGSVSISSISGSVSNTGANLNIGGISSAGEHFPGSLDEVRIYSRALSAEEIENSFVETTDWNAGRGVPTRQTDINGQATDYEYDTFNRLTKAIKPGDSSGSPSLEYQYTDWGIINQQHVKTITKVDGSNSLWQKEFFDGLGRIVQVQTSGETEGGTTYTSIPSTTAYDTRGLVDRQYVGQRVVCSPNPCNYQAPPSPPNDWKAASYSYDGLARLTTQTNADGTTVSSDYSVPWQTTVTDENGNKKDYSYDAFGRLIQVAERLAAYVFQKRIGLWQLDGGQFSSPRGMAVDSSGNVYVADYYYNRVQKFDSNGAFITKWGSTGSGDGQFNGPRGIAVDGSGNVYVVEENNHRVQKFDSNGTFISKWGSQGSIDGRFSYPKGIAADSQGYVYVADTSNNRIQKFDSSGTFVTKWGSYGSGDGQFAYPGSVVIDSSGYVYVADTSNHRVQKFNSSGAFQTKWGSYGTGDGQFNSPQGIAVDSSGYVYVVEYGNHRVQKFSSGGTFQTKWGSNGSGDGQFYQPQGVAANSYVYVADSGYTNNRIQKFTTSGTFQTKWGATSAGDGRFYNPMDTAVDSQGYVYVADYSNHRIQKFNPNGTFNAKWGSNGSGDGEFSYPQGIAVDGSGNVYVADTGNHRIQKFSSSGTFLAKWGSSGSGDGQFSSPRAVDVDSSGYVYVADTNNHRVQKFSSGGVFQAKWGSNGTGDGQFSAPEGITVDGQGNVYVADTGNNRIQKFNASGAFLTKWGTYGSGNGQFSSPRGLAADGQSYIYVADYINHRVQKFDSSGVFQTKWGSSGAGDGQFNYPRGVVVDSQGYAYVADKSNNRVQKFTITPTTTYSYDLLGNLTQVVDSNGTSTTISYDWLSRKTGMTDPSMGSWSYGYDSNGNLTSQTDAESQTITFLYDALNRLTGKTYPGGSGMTNVIYTYDDIIGGNYGKGRRTSMTDALGTNSLTYKYDARGRLIEEKQTADGTVYTTGHSYDGADRISTVTYPTGKVVTETYNGRGLPYSLYVSGGTTFVSSVLYNQLGQTTELLLGNTLKTTFGYYGTGGTYDTTGGYYGRLWEIKALPQVGGTAVQDVKHTWDARGNMTQREDVLVTQTETFGYDALDRLTSVSGPYSQTYAYNLIGNIISNNGVSYSYGAAKPQALIYQGTTGYAYDANGNMTARGTQTLTWDVENRVSSVSGGASFVYDGDGNRVKKTEGGETTLYANRYYEVVSPGQAGMWHFDENSGTSAADGSGNGNTGTLTNGPGWVSGKWGSALSFDGVDDYVNVPRSSSLEPTGAISVAFWYKPTVVTGSQRPIDKGVFGTNQGYQVAREGNLVRFYVGNGSGTQSGASGPYLTQGQWNFVVGTFDGRYVKVYLHGVLQSTVGDFGSNTTISHANIPLLIGGGESYDNAALEDVSMWNRALSAAEIESMYQSGVTTANKTVTTSYYLGGKLVAQKEGATLRYIHQDSLSGTSVVTTDLGVVVSSIKYYPFGGTRSGSVPTDVKFTGQRLDDTGLYYYGARYYDAAIGRFASADPTVPSMTNPQALNRYSYVVNNPLKYTDPTGLFYVQNVGGIPLQDCDMDGACVTVSDPGGYEGSPVSNPCLSDPLCGIVITPPADLPLVGPPAPPATEPPAPAMPQPSFNLPPTPIPPRLVPAPTKVPVTIGPKREGEYRSLPAPPTKSLEQQRWEEDMKWVRDHGREASLRVGGAVVVTYNSAIVVNTALTVGVFCRGGPKLCGGAVAFYAATYWQAQTNIKRGLQMMSGRYPAP